MAKLNWLCKLGIHKWGKVKQWVVDGKVITTSRCKRCGKLRDK